MADSQENACRFLTEISNRGFITVRWAPWPREHSRHRATPPRTTRRATWSGGTSYSHRSTADRRGVLIRWSRSLLWLQTTPPYLTRPELPPSRSRHREPPFTRGGSGKSGRSAPEQAPDHHCAELGLVGNPKVRPTNPGCRLLGIGHYSRSVDWSARGPRRCINGLTGRLGVAQQGNCRKADPENGTPPRPRV